MTDSSAPGASPPVRFLDLPSTSNESLVATRTLRSIRVAVEELPRALWVHGPDGAGKTSALWATLSSCDDRRAVKRVCCHEGDRLEEFLYAVNDFLRQLGIEDLDRVLNQRSLLDSKLEVLFQILAEHSILIWIDDVHNLEAGDHRGARSEISHFFRRLGNLPLESKGGVILSSRCAADDDWSGARVETERLNEDEVRTLHSRFRGDANISQHPADVIPSTPLFTLLLARNAEIVSGRHSPEAFFKASFDALSDASRALLEIIAVFSGPVSRRALRDLSAVDDLAIEMDSADLDPRFDELQTHGWIELDARRDHWHCSLHPAFRRRIEKIVLSTQPARWKALLGGLAMYHARLASKGRDPWQFYRARRMLFASDRVEEACLLNQCFLEEFLKFGYFQLASKILAETVANTRGSARAVALGNQAIICKNLGEYDRALEIYQEAHDELENLGDPTNVARILHQIGNTQYLSGNLEKALAMYEKSHAISSETNDDAVAAATQIQIGNILWSLGRKAESMERYEKCIAELDASKDAPLLSAIQFQMAQAKLEDRQFLDAVSLFRESANNARSNNDRRALLKALRGGAIAARESLDFDSARARYEEASALASQLGDHLEIIDCLAARADFEMHRSCFGEALSFLLDARAVLNSIAGESFTGKQLQAVEETLGEKIRQLENRMDETNGAEESDRKTTSPEDD